jgi:37-kD nucleoid-associated bacterial protein
MLLENLTVGRILVHEVFQRQDERRALPPTYAAGLEKLSPEASGAFRLRITEALSAKAKSREMDIVKFGDDSHLADASALLDADDGAFLALSRKVADRLAAAQMWRSIPGGMVIVFDGSAGAPACRFLGVIKAEVQSAFRRRQDAQAVITEFLNNVFLTPATRLYKIGIMVRLDPNKPRPEGWKAFVFDSNITSSHRESAAQYFYEGFLGCALPADGAYDTGRFFDLTKEFVRKTELPQEKRRDLFDALYTFVKTETAKTFTSEEFGEKYLPVELRDDFTGFLTGRRFPARAWSEMSQIWAPSYGGGATASARISSFPHRRRRWRRRRRRSR